MRIIYIMLNEIRQIKITIYMGLTENVVPDEANRFVAGLRPYISATCHTPTLVWCMVEPLQDGRECRCRRPETDQFKPELDVPATEMRGRHGILATDQVA